MVYIKTVVDTLTPKIDPRRWKGALRELAEWCAFALEREATEKVPVDTGNLRASLKGSYREVGDGYVATIGTPVHYAPYQEFGTRGGYVIAPRRARALSWVTRGGRRVFAMRVIHPGVRPKRFMRYAVETVFNRVADEFRRQGWL